MPWAREFDAQGLTNLAQTLAKLDMQKDSLWLGVHKFIYTFIHIHTPI